MAYRNWIGGTYNAGTYPLWTTTTNWSPNGSVASGSVGYFDVASSNSTSGQTKSPDVFVNHGSSVNPALLGGIDLQSSFAGTTVQLDDPGGGWRLYCNSVDTPYIYTVAAGKQVNLNADGTGATPGNTFFDGQPTANVASTGKLTFCTFNGTTDFGPFLKHGAGAMYLAYRAVRATGVTATARSSTYVGGITINGGSVVIRASDMAAMQALSRVNPFGTGPITFNTASAVLQIEADTTGATVSCANALVLTTAGTMQLNGAGNVLTFTSASGASGSGVLSITGPGTTSFAGTVSCPLSLTSTTVTMGANSFTGSTLSGNGTLAMGGGALGSASNIDASGHTGTISGSCSISSNTSSAFNSIFSGTITAITGASAAVTFTGNSTGAITAMSAATVTLSGSGAFSTNTVGPTTATNTNLRISGASAGFASGRTLALAGTAKLSLLGAAAAANAVTSTSASAVTIECADTSTTTYSGNFTRSSGVGGVTVQAATGGTLVLSGAFSSTTAYSLNAVGSGTLKVTGTGFSGATATLSNGWLHIAGTSNKNIGTTLTVNSGAKVAYNPDAPVTLTGNLSLAANSTFRFGAPV